MPNDASEPNGFRKASAPREETRSTICKGDEIAASISIAKEDIDPRLSRATKVRFADIDIDAYHVRLAVLGKFSREICSRALNNGRLNL